MRLIPVAFTQKELSDFRPIFDLASAKLTGSWNIGEPNTTGDGYIVSVHSDEELSHLIETTPSFDRIIIYTSESVPATFPWTLTRRIDAPPRITEVREVLEKISQFLEQSRTESAADESKTTTRPLQNLTDTVEKVEVSTQPYDILAEDLPTCTRIVYTETDLPESNIEEAIEVDTVSDNISDKNDTENTSNYKDYKSEENGFTHKTGFFDKPVWLGKLLHGFSRRSDK